MKANKKRIDAAGQEYGANEKDRFEPGGGGDCSGKTRAIKVAPKIGP